MYKASLVSLLCHLHHPATPIITQTSKHKPKQQSSTLFSQRHLKHSINHTMEFLVRKIESNLHKSGMADNTPVQATTSTYATKHLLHPALQSDSASSTYSQKSSASSTRRDFTSFLSRSNSSEKKSNNSSRANSTASKRSTREFVSSMSAYPWVTGSSENGLTSSAASSVRSKGEKKRSEKAKKDEEVWHWTFPCLSGCV
ncbi:hypothetical protein CB0940_02921 [Cercospora beticola]|uniref:Uncharacterized protein n=2 Tax=Cercospora beticola TaxID=122368 RepID=A0A2G5I5P5_CERBT|nr:hypothetical protein CB0940_02921 [Cercospora beticola]PIB00130.1 hypothetical protein CB0940_02921 [Cercospora beticola]